MNGNKRVVPHLKHPFETLQGCCRAFKGPRPTWLSDPAGFKRLCKNSSLPFYSLIILMGNIRKLNHHTSYIMYLKLVQWFTVEFSIIHYTMCCGLDNQEWLLKYGLSVLGNHGY